MRVVNRSYSNTFFLAIEFWKHFLKIQWHEKFVKYHTTLLLPVSLLEGNQNYKRGQDILHFIYIRDEAELEIEAAKIEALK